jgi:hypothetical protein
MPIVFEPLPVEHELSLACAALVASEDQRGGLIAHAHRIRRDDEVSDSVLSDAYVTLLGHHGLGTSWAPVPLDDLWHVLSVLVARDLAYKVEIMDRDRAREVVRRWLGGFPRPYRAYTNGELLQAHAKPESSCAGWCPVVGATFDTGAIVIGGDVIGMLWAADED